MSQMIGLVMIVVVLSLLRILYSQKIKIILSVCGALITIIDSSCYFIVIFFRRSGSSRLNCLLPYIIVLVCYFCGAEWHECVV